MRFKVGDKVRVIHGTVDVRKGSEGTVHKVRNSNINWPVEVNFGDGKFELFKEVELSHVENLSGENDPVNHPAHYTSGPVHSACGKIIEVIDITEVEGFRIGNALKYILRRKHKGNELQDLQKAAFYLEREIEALKNR